VPDNGQPPSLLIATCTSPLTTTSVKKAHNLQLTSPKYLAMLCTYINQLTAAICYSIPSLLVLQPITAIFILCHVQQSMTAAIFGLCHAHHVCRLPPCYSACTNRVAASSLSNMPGPPCPLFAAIFTQCHVHQSAELSPYLLACSARRESARSCKLNQSGDGAVLVFGLSPGGVLTLTENNLHLNIFSFQVL
jgi:hypothetical protein